MKKEISTLISTAIKMSYFQQGAGLGWQGGLIRLKKAGLNRMDKIGFFQTNFEKIH